ncbi:hypothetical protein Mgra_00005341 [Meloidogyne graminicola]|uniref:TIL domain-containing protein n=1 Tax=Meloidogyne graminicola TaxID=189291 RepID=A0A8S9ZQ85_9BILA|nr:hypothetical protein Mgra_00005341 [Meloidogyne graminicola]
MYWNIIKTKQKTTTTTDFPLNKQIHFLCFSLRCFPGCRCNDGYVRENNEKNAKCILPEECKYITTTTVETTTKKCEEIENN